MKMLRPDKSKGRILIFMNKSKFIAVLFKLCDKQGFFGY